MPVNERREKVFLQLPEDCARALFVSLNKFGVPDDIGNENRRKSPFRLAFDHAKISRNLPPQIMLERRRPASKPEKFTGRS